MVVGHVDQDLLDRLSGALGQSPGSVRHGAGSRDGGPRRAASANGSHRPAGAEALAARAAGELVLSQATALLSGPSGLAAYLRRRVLTGPAASISLPLDVGAATETIPPHLRRAVAVRDRHCSFAGCDQPPMACQVHHVIPRSEGGATKLDNLVLLCSFHHLIVLHRWGWGFRLNADGTTTAVSPDGSRTLHSHSPPARAA
jgi:HNH endonuclease